MNFTMWNRVISRAFSRCCLKKPTEQFIITKPDLKKREIGIYTTTVVERESEMLYTKTALQNCIHGTWQIYHKTF